MPEWKNEECRSLIAARYGERAAETALPAILSVQWKIRLAGYHACESKSLLEQFTGSWTDMMRYSFSTASEGGQEFSVAAAKSEAHLIACAAAIHSLADIMANVVFIGAGLPPDIPEDRRSLHSVANALKQAQAAPFIVKALEDLGQSESFKYIQAYVNTTKHRSLISNQVSIHFGPPGKQGFKVMEFKYKDRCFPSTWFDTVADEYRDSVGALIIEIGNALNQWLKNPA